MKRRKKRKKKSCRQVGYDQVLHFVAAIPGHLELLAVVVVIEGSGEKTDQNSVNLNSRPKVKNVFSLHAYYLIEQHEAQQSAVPFMYLLVSSLLCHQDLVLLRGVFIPVRRFWTFTVNVLKQRQRRQKILSFAITNISVYAHCGQ